MTTTIGSLDLNAFSDLYSDSTQYFWFEPNASATYGAGAHVTLVPDTSFISNPTGQNILMNTDGFSIRNVLLPMMTLDNNSLGFNAVDTTAGTYTNVATFGADGTQIGTDDDVHIEIDKDSFIMKDNLGNEFAHIGSPSGSQITDTFVYNIDTYFLLTFTPVDEPVVLLNGNSLVDGTDYTISNRNLHVTTSLQKGDVIEVTYTSSNQKKYYIFGTSTGNPGLYSFLEGSMVSASGPYGAHAEGNHTSASGGYGAHAEGHYTEAIGDFSHAQNFHTIAGYNTQTVIGAYNDNKPYSLFEIGNGEDSEHRSNALTVDWDGNVEAAGEVHGTLSNPTISITASTGTLQSATVYKQGNVVQLLVSVQKTTATASGQNVFAGTINTTALRPKMTTTSGTYYGSYALNAIITTDGVITIRNADSRQFNAMTLNGNISFTYLID